MRELLGTPLDQISEDRLRAVLEGAGDEDGRWEAKGGTLRSEHVSRAVAGLANRDGGLLVIGATRLATGGWELTGCAIAGEPGQWLARVVRDNLRPPPPIDLRTWEVAPGIHAALVRVQPHPTHLTVTVDGRVLRREHGSTEPLADGAELTRLVRARSGAGPAAPLDPDGDPGEIGDTALAASQAGHEARVRSFVAGLQARLPRAAQFAPADTLDIEADRLSAVAAALAQAVPDSPVTTFAVEAHHRAFDAATAIRPLPGGRPDLDLQRVMLRHARALGAMLVRLELWALVRELIDHDAPDPAIYAGWMTYVGVQQARALGRPPNAETLRWPVREAVSTAQRIGALRPDGADEHHVLESLLVFDLLTNVIELDRSERSGGPTELSPDFAVFGLEPHRPMSRGSFARRTFGGRCSQADQWMTPHDCSLRWTAKRTARPTRSEESGTASPTAKLPRDTASHADRCGRPRRGKLIACASGCGFRQKRTKRALAIEELQSLLASSRTVRPGR